MFCRIAAIALITRSSYHFVYLRHFNFTGHEKYIVKEAKKLSKIDWFRSSTGSFGEFYSIPFAEMLTKRGMAFSFNILAFDDLLNKKT